MCYYTFSWNSFLARNQFPRTLKSFNPSPIKLKKHCVSKAKFESTDALRKMDQVRWQNNITRMFILMQDLQLLGRGQVVRVLAFYSRRSKFEYRWSLQFFSVKYLFEKNKNQQKEAVVGSYFKKISNFHSTTSIAQLS